MQAKVGDQIMVRATHVGEQVRKGAGQPAPRCLCLVADSLAWPACPPRCAESIAERRMGRASSEAKALAFARSRSFAATPLRWNSGATKR